MKIRSWKWLKYHCKSSENNTLYSYADKPSTYLLINYKTHGFICGWAYPRMSLSKFEKKFKEKENRWCIISPENIFSLKMVKTLPVAASVVLIGITLIVAHLALYTAILTFFIGQEMKRLFCCWNLVVSRPRMLIRWSSDISNC